MIHLLKNRLTLLRLLFLLEGLTVLALTLGVIPAKSALVLTGILLLYIVVAPLSNALVLTVASIPLFIALPLTQDFNQMANWRILITALFLSWVIQGRLWEQLRSVRIPRLCATEWIGIGLFLTFVLSLLFAHDVVAGVKKILFLANAVLLYAVVRSVVRDLETVKRILRAAVTGVALALAVGYGQYLIVQFASLYDFWQYWASYVIPIFYGNALGVLLKESNTWFSYYANAPPTLRMFSVFPDSHSFGLFSMLGAAALLAFMQDRPRIWNIDRRFFLLAGIWTLAALAIFLSGSRGLWTAAMIVFLFLLVLRFSAMKRPLFMRRETILFLFLFAVGVTTTVVVTNNLAYVLEFGGCNRYALLCSSLLWGLFSIPGGIAIVGLLILLSAGGAFSGIVASKILSTPTLWTQRAVITFLIFFLLFPVASIITAQAHGTGVVTEEADLAFFRARSILDITETSNRSRLDIWAASIKSIMQRPIFGVGVGNFPIVLGQDISAARRGSSAHNLYLDSMAEAGIAAGVLLFCFFLLQLWTMRGLLCRAKTFLAGGFALSFGLHFLWIMGYNVFDVVLLNDKVLLLYLVLSALLVAFVRINRETPGPTIYDRTRQLNIRTPYGCE